MEFFRNPEIGRGLALWGIGTCAVVAAGWHLAGQGGAAVGAAASLLFGTFHVVMTGRRYRRLAELADEIRHFRHDSPCEDIAGEREGELSILCAEIRKMTQKMSRQAELLAEDKRFLMDSIADISHQIRTPLTALNLIATRLRGDCGEETRRELVRELERLLCHMDWLIQSLLKMAKLDAGTIRMKAEPVLAGVLAKMATQELVIPMELRRQALAISCPPDVHFRGDLSWSAEALGNIVKNCMEHTPEGGVVRVEARENQLFTEIVVSDSGPGIDAKDLPHIFERFYKGRQSSKDSVGIGLALAKMIFEKQGGTLSAANAREGGARFEIRFYKSVV